MDCRKRRKFFICKISIILLTQGCTSWKDAGSFYRTEQTKLTVESSPQGKLFVNNRYIGDTPTSTPLEYEQKVNKTTREVNYWVTQPGWSFFLTLLSIGVYLPFSLIPVDTETKLTPTGTFANNEFDIKVQAEGYTTWERRLTCNGQDTIPIATTLDPER